MAQFDVPVAAVPNQFFSTTLNGVTWQITLNMRKDKLYASLESSDSKVLHNRVCLDRTYIGFGFFFYDIDGTSDPTYDGLGTRYLMVWGDGQ